MEQNNSPEAEMWKEIESSEHGEIFSGKEYTNTEFLYFK